MTARRLLEQIRGQVADGASLEEVLARYQPAANRANSVEAWLRRWLDVRRRETEAGSLSPNYLRELQRLCGPSGYFAFFRDQSIHEITYGTLEDFVLWLGDQGLAPKSRRNYLAAFMAFLKWLHRRRQIRELPEAPRIRVDEHEPRLLSIRDQDAVLEAIPEAERGIFFAMAHLGLRPGGARALTVADYRDGWLHINKAIKGKSVSAPVRGTGKSQTAPRK